MTKTDKPSNFPIRLQAFLAKSGFGSRRYCEKLITEGKVSLNGRITTELGTKVNQNDTVECCGRDALPNRKVYLALHKPRGYLTSNYDPHHTLFAVDLIDIPEKSSLFHVGRLDKDSSGLIFFTNDGDFAQRVSHPSYEIEKEYEVYVDKPLKFTQVKHALTKGVSVENITYRFRSVSQISDTCIRVILTEGKNREIRKAFTSLGYTVTALHRIRIDGIVLGTLPSGVYRRLTKNEISSITGASK
jgi:23S rRNA pseudouridine2605 synthase